MLYEDFVTYIPLLDILLVASRLKHSWVKQLHGSAARYAGRGMSALLTKIYPIRST
jgi:hypothetical protein